VCHVFLFFHLWCCKFLIVLDFRARLVCIVAFLPLHGLLHMDSLSSRGHQVTAGRGRRARHPERPRAAPIFVLELNMYAITPPKSDPNVEDVERGERGGGGMCVCPP
jgi:hypothetical protein